MSEAQIDFSAPAELRKWPSVNKQRVSASLGACPYLIGDCVTLDECIAWFMLLPESQHHLYEIHTAPQSDLVSAILSAEDVIELARLRDYLGNFGASDEGCEGFGGMVAGGLGRGVWRL